MDIERRLDLRDVPTPQHHAHAATAFGALRENEVLYIAYGYEPRPLRQYLNDRFAERFMWSQRRLGDGRWEVALRRVTPAVETSPVADVMSHCALFVNAGDATRTTLANTALTRAVGRRQAVANQGMAWPYLGVVRRGRIIAIAGTPAGREQILFDVVPYETFGDVVVADSGTALARFVTHAEPAELVLFPRGTVLECAAKDAALALALAQACAQRSRTLVELLVQGSKPIIARVAAALLTHAPTEPGLAPVNASSLPALRFAQVAAAAGTVKEVVARSIAQARKGRCPAPRAGPNRVHRPREARELRLSRSDCQREAQREDVFGERGRNRAKLLDRCQARGVPAVRSDQRARDCGSDAQNLRALRPLRDLAAAVDAARDAGRNAGKLRARGVCGSRSATYSPPAASSRSTMPRNALLKAKGCGAGKGAQTARDADSEGAQNQQLHGVPILFVFLTPPVERPRKRTSFGGMLVSTAD